MNLRITLFLTCSLVVASTVTSVSAQIVEPKPQNLPLTVSKYWDDYFPRIPGCGSKIGSIVKYDDGYGQGAHYEKLFPPPIDGIDQVILSERDLSPDARNCGSVSFRLWLPNKRPVIEPPQRKLSKKEIKQQRKFNEFLRLWPNSRGQQPERVPIKIGKFDAVRTVYFLRCDLPCAVMQVTIQVSFDRGKELYLVFMGNVDKATAVAESINYQKLADLMNEYSKNWNTATEK